MKTLIIVDPQNDFMPGGSLEVPKGDEIVPVINRIMSKFDLVVATQDWHPKNHGSFASNHEGKKPFDKTMLYGTEQILWPDHCVQNSNGANFHSDLNTKPIEAIFRKGMDPAIDSYSGFFDNGHKKRTGLSGYLKDRQSNEVYIAGLAADVCVQYTLRDAIAEGFETWLIEDATRALDAGAFKSIKKELSELGCHFTESRHVQ
ncbi:MAG TPA: bifunctional nicotinamidase/pyrazinamidase [Bacteroidales bacterium]|nr:bifunctional nicotinamidase/pyrazinamidase [Bacteroidales bacterium]